MEKKIVMATEFTAREENGKTILYHKRGYVVWENGKWSDPNKGKMYLNWQAREELVKAFNLR